MKARKKPVVVKVWQFRPHEAGFTFPGWVDPKWFHYSDDGRITHMTIPTLEGDHRASKDDWIIQGVKGEVYSRKPDIFEKTYDLLPD